MSKILQFLFQRKTTPAISITPPKESFTQSTCQKECFIENREYFVCNKYCKVQCNKLSRHFVHFAQWGHQKLALKSKQMLKDNQCYPHLLNK